MVAEWSGDDSAEEARDDYAPAWEIVVWRLSLPWRLDCLSSGPAMIQVTVRQRDNNLCVATRPIKQKFPAHRSDSVGFSFGVISNPIRLLPVRAGFQKPLKIWFEFGFLPTRNNFDELE